MGKYLCKLNSEYRVDSMDEVKNLETIVRNQAREKEYQVVSYTWVEKEVTYKGEVIDKYYQVKVQEKFNNPKEPNLMVSGYDLDFSEGVF